MAKSLKKLLKDCCVRPMLAVPGVYCSKGPIWELETHGKTEFQRFLNGFKDSAENIEHNIDSTLQAFFLPPIGVAYYDFYWKFKQYVGGFKPLPAVRSYILVNKPNNLTRCVQINQDFLGDLSFQFFVMNGYRYCDNTRFKNARTFFPVKATVAEPGISVYSAVKICRARKRHKTVNWTIDPLGRDALNHPEFVHGPQFTKSIETIADVFNKSFRKMEYTSIDPCHFGHQRVWVVRDNV